MERFNQEYIIAFDPYVTQPKNFYHRFRKWLGLSWAGKEELRTEIKIGKINKDGTIDLNKPI